MKKTLSLAVLILVGWPLLASSHAAESPAPVSGPPAPMADMVAGSAAVLPPRTAAGFGPDSEILLPVVINASGLNGTFFKTDAFFANFRNANQEVLLRFVTSGVSGAGQTPIRTSINALTSVSAVDILGPESGELARSGVFALLITSVLPGTNTVDPNGKLLSMFRIWTPQPGTAGTASFGAWGPPSDNIHGFNGAIALGLRQNAAFRTNFGLVNLDPVNTRSWTVTILSGGTPTTITIALAPLSMQLVAVPATITPSANGYVSILFVPSATPATDFRWSAFGVSADNITGDSWLNLATQSSPLPGNFSNITDAAAGSLAVRPQQSTSGFGPDSDLLLPVVINASGLNGTFFKTDASFANSRNNNQEILVRFIPAGVSGVGQPAVRTTFSALTSGTITDIIGPESGDLSRTGVGALQVTAVLPGTNTVDTNGKLLSMFRIWTPQPGSAGTASFGAWGPPADNIHGLNGAIALGLRQNAAFRTNFGLVNLDPVNTRSWTVTILSAGTPTSIPISLAPLSTQLIAVPATITPSPNGYISILFVPSATPVTDFRWSAFGVTADNVTGDSWLNLATQSATLPVNISND